MKYELEPYQLADESGEAINKCALRVTRLDPNFDTEAEVFLSERTFHNEEDALRYGVRFVAARGGRIRKAVFQRLKRKI